MNSTILSLVTLFILVLGVFVVAAENQTTNESVGNKSKSANNTSVQPLSLWVSVNVEPSVLNLGTVPPDGIERSYPEVATVTVIYFLAFNDRLSVRASGDLVNADGSTIPCRILSSAHPMFLKDPSQHQIIPY